MIRPILVLLLVGACHTDDPPGDRPERPSDTPTTESTTEPTIPPTTGLMTLTLSGVELDFQPYLRFYAVRASALEALTEVEAVPVNPEATVILRIETATGALLEDDVGTSLSLGPDERLEIDVIDDGVVQTWAVSFTPDDLPPLTFTGVAPDEFFFLTPKDYGTAYDPSGYSRFLLILDGHGTPVWWMTVPSNAYDFRPTPFGELTANLSYAGDGGLLPTRMDLTGVQIERWSTDLPDPWTSPSGDPHELYVSTDGSITQVVYGFLEEDLTAFGGGVQGVLRDSVVARYDADGLLSTWSPRPHLVLAELPADVLAQIPSPTWRYGHINSVDPVEGGWVTSLRAPGEIWRVDGATGEIVWRLGGAHSDFQIVDDPHGGFYGQHSARFVEPDRVILFDNRRNLNSPDMGDVRAVEYVLDFAAGEARLVFEHALPGAGGAKFSGSVQRLEDGRTVVGWGSTQLLGDGTRAPTISVFDPDGSITAALALPLGMYSYRVWMVAGDPTTGAWRPEP